MAYPPLTVSATSCLNRLDKGGGPEERARTVENVRKRWVNEGMEAALNRKRQCRPSRQRILDGEKEAKLVAICCGKVPSGRARWTLTLLADELVRQEIVESISRAGFGTPYNGPQISRNML